MVMTGGWREGDGIGQQCKDRVAETSIGDWWAEKGGEARPGRGQARLAKKDKD